MRFMLIRAIWDSELLLTEYLTSYIDELEGRKESKKQNRKIQRKERKLVCILEGA